MGSFLGPFLAVILSAIGFWLKSKIEGRKERKELLRCIEVSITRTLNDTYTIREQLRRFLEMVRRLEADARAITNPRMFFLERINFPAIREVYRDMEMPNFKVKSYYLHNKVLFVDAGAKEINETIAMLKNDFEGLIRQNEMLVALMRNNPNPPAQRQMYADNLRNFVNAVERYIAHIQEGIKFMTQIKVYNDNLRKKHGYWFRWKNESTKFKYFLNKTEQKKFARNPVSLDRIDSVIENEVQKSIEEAEARHESLTRNRHDN